MSKAARALARGSRRGHPRWDAGRDLLYSQASHPKHRSSMPSSAKVKKSVRIASGRKRVRQDVLINAANTSLRSKFRTAIKGVLKAVSAGDKVKASETFRTAQKVIDSIADKGLFHKNKAARHKSRLAAKVKALAA